MAKQAGSIQVWVNGAKGRFTLLTPAELKVTTVYNTRGGIDSTCSVDSKAQHPGLKSRAREGEASHGKASG